MDEKAMALEQMKSQMKAQMLAIQALLLTLSRTGILRPAEIVALKVEILDQIAELRWTGASPADAIRMAEAIEEVFSFLN